MDRQIITKLHKNFEDYAHNKDSVEFWYARDLQILFKYEEWRNFESVIKKAKIACEVAGQNVIDHFVGVNKTIEMPKNASKEIKIKLKQKIREIAEILEITLDAFIQNCHSSLSIAD